MSRRKGGDFVDFARRLCYTDSNVKRRIRAGKGYDMRYRQIHLDFHTAPVISDVGRDFDAEDFAATLRAAHVNSINIFAKCHHGMCYYPTKVGKMHPALGFDLMGTMITVLHRNDIRCPLYFPIGWEEDAAEHTEWLEVGRDGIPGHKRKDDATYNTWRKLCLNNEDYKNYIRRQLKELIDGYEVDGLWFDIIFQQRCICPTCAAEMRLLGMNPDDERDVLRHDEYVLRKFQKEINTFVKSFGKDIPTFYNSSWMPNTGLDGLSIEERSHCQDHMEIESLPSGDWGYNHFPFFVNYHNRHNENVIGMNGKFHLTWGDHGSLKNNEALEYECFRMLANGAACSVGDQLHPRGVMNKAAYARIGRVYEVIEKVEPEVEGSAKVADIGVVVSTDFYTKDTTADEGVMRMLMELHYTFDFIPADEELNRYRLLILPDHVETDEAFRKRMEAYLKQGGKVIATYHSCMDGISVHYVGENAYEPAYLVSEEGAFAGVEPLEYVCYRRGALVTSELPVKAYIGEPYYNRTADCFSSHRQFPFDRISEHPAVLLGEQVGYCAFPLFTDYMQNGNRVYRDVIAELLSQLLPKPAVRIAAPTCAEITVRRKAGATSVHIISYIPERRTRTIDIVDTRIPLYGVKVSVPAEKAYRCARLARSGEELPVTVKDGYATTVVPEIDGYECVVFVPEQQR